MASDSKFREHYKRLPVWPEKAVVDKNVDGIIPSCRVESWQDVEQVVNNLWSEFGSDDFVFRGHANYTWKLTPTLDRIADKAIGEALATTQLQNFQLSIRGRIDDRTLFEPLELADEKQSLELWAIGQHHELATPLLDWTRSPYVAMFFAFEKMDEEAWVDLKGNPSNYSRAIYFLNREFIEDSESDDYVKIVEPSKDDHGRLVNQAGLFSLAPYDETLESALLRALTDSRVDVDDPNELGKYICKIHIPNDSDSRIECLRHLRRMNIHHASLFPDLIGSSKYCNELARDFAAARRTSGDEPGVVSKPETDYWARHKLPLDDKGLQPLVDALLVSNEAKSAKPDDLLVVARMTVEFVNTQAGVDWYKRESEKARLRTIIRRRLGKLQFDENSIDAAAAAIVELAAEMAERSEREAAHAVAVPSKASVNNSNKVDKKKAKAKKRKKSK